MVFLSLSLFLPFSFISDIRQFKVVYSKIDLDFQSHYLYVRPPTRAVFTSILSSLSPTQSHNDKISVRLVAKSGMTSTTLVQSPPLTEDKSVFWRRGGTKRFTGIRRRKKEYIVHRVSSIQHLRPDLTQSSLQILRQRGSFGKADLHILFLRCFLFHCLLELNSVKTLILLS